MTVALPVFCFVLPDTNARRPGRLAFGRRTWTVDAQLHALGGVGEHVGQGTPQVGLARHGEPAGGQQRADLADRAGDGAAMHLVEQGQGGVRELEAQHDQGHDDPVGEHQVMVRARAFGPLPGAAPTLTQLGILLRGPRSGQFGDELGQPVPGDTGKIRCDKAARLSLDATIVIFPPGHSHDRSGSLSFRAPSRNRQPGPREVGVR